MLDIHHAIYNLLISSACYTLIHLVNKHGIELKFSHFLNAYKAMIALFTLEFLYHVVDFPYFLLTRRICVSFCYYFLGRILIEHYVAHSKQKLFELILRFSSFAVIAGFILVDGAKVQLPLAVPYGIILSGTLVLLVSIALETRETIIYLLFSVIVAIGLLFFLVDIRSFQDDIAYFTFIINLLVVSMYMSIRSKILNTKVRDFETLTESQETIFKFISHDIRGPLASIGAYNSEIAASEKGKDFAEQTSRIGVNVTSINDLLEKFVSIARIKSHRVNLEWVDLELFTRTVIYSNGQLFESVDYEVRYDFDKTKVLTDPFYLGRILKNLIENSVKYKHEDRGLILNVSLKIMPNGTPRFTVEDNGIGVKNPTKLFQDVYRENTKRQAEGFGYGLTLIKFAIEKLGWGIRVESEVGEFTRFVMELPEDYIGNE